MDRERFDELARLLATRGSRRGALGALLGVAILGHDPDDADAKKGRGRKRGNDRGGNKKNRDRNNNRNHRQSNNGDNDGNAAQRSAEPEVQAEDVAAAPEGEAQAAPEVQAEAAGGKRKAKGKGRGKGKGKGRNKKQAGNRTAQTQAEATTCCGTRSCARPSRGSNSYECNYAGQNLSGGDYRSANMGKIDGRGTNFSTANVTSVNFGEACLQGANFRGATVTSANFGKACLFFADFTGAVGFNSTVNWSTALLCGTTLANGTVSNRDCDKATTCCSACDAQRPCTNGQICCNGRCVTGQCCAAGDCANRVCQTKTCTNNQCQYSPVTGGACPAAGGGTGTCCGGVCCAANQVCDTRPNPDVCCTPDTKNQTCGVNTQNPKCGNVINNCGQTVDCGPCAPRTCKTGTCNDATDTCEYTNQQNGQPGTNCTIICCSGNCCDGGQVCFQNNCCTPDTNVCQGKCGNVTNNCGQTVNCGPCPDRLCQTGSCTGPNNTCAFTPVSNGQPGPQCPAPGFCCGGDECCSSNQVCFNNNCCTPNNDICQGKCGNVTNNCGQIVDCGRCPVRTCQDGSCNAQNTCDYVDSADNQPGPNCPEPGFCCDGDCCAEGDVCLANGCCTPQTRAQTCNGKCGNVVNNCGQTVDCGPCDPVVCQTGTCGATNICTYANQPSGQPGTLCSDPQVCCQGACCAVGQVCDTRPNPDVCCTPETKSHTCRPATGPQRCGISVVNNCGQLIDCGACDVLTCQTSNCNGAPNGTCQYTDVFGTIGPNCTTVCCRDEQGDPVCCEPGIEICSSEGRCGCGGDHDCGANEICCNGTCIANTLCCDNDPSTCPNPGTCKVRGCNAQGECAPVNAAPSTQCSIGQDLGICCNGQCLVDDPNNCTACGTACPAGTCQVATCDNRVCGITNLNNTTAAGCNAEGFLCCAGACVDTDTDEDNCGGCAPPNGDGDICVEPGELCVNGVCVCNAESCPNGCCSNGPGNPGICRTSSDTSCGINGVQCIDCPDGQACNAAGICVCTAQSCSGGCCSNGPGNVGTCQTNGNDTCGVGGVQCVDCPSNAPFCNANGVCVACLTPANCPTPPTCSVATCTAGVCGTAPLQDVQGPGCTAAGKICCNGFCVDDLAGQCPICCQSPEICREAFGPQAECVGSGACRVGGVDTCVSTGKCCRP